MAISIISSNSNSLSAYTLRRTQQTQSQSVGRISSGTNSTPGGSGVPSDSLALRLKNSTANDAKFLANVGSALSFLEAQANSLRQISNVVSAMGETVSKMQDVTKRTSDLDNYMQEFNALRQQLTNERNATFGGLSLHNKTGDPSEQPLSVSLDASGTKTISVTKSNFNANGGTSWDELVGIISQSVEVDAAAAANAAANAAATEARNAAALQAAINAAANGQTLDNGQPAGDDTSYGNTDSDVTSGSSSSGTSGSGVSNLLEVSEGQGTKNKTDTAKNLLENGWVSTAFIQLLEGTSSMLAENGALQTALTFAVDSITNRSQENSEFYSKITESDVAKEVATLAKAELSTKSSSSAMTQTNVTAEGVLKALWGEPSSGIEWYQPPKMTSNFESIEFKVPSASL